MLEVPAVPDIDPEQRSTARFLPRYEDIAQDGRVVLGALTPALGLAVWPKLMSRPEAMQNRNAGIVPILTYFAVSGTTGPFSIENPFRADCAYDFAHTIGPDGQVDRILVNMWADLHAPLGRVYGPPPENAGEVRLAGRLFAQHVVTRLFAPPGERKVVALPDKDGVPQVPRARGQWTSPMDLLSLPPGAVLLDAKLRPDDVDVSFGIDHTDNNQHVNSGVYPRMFADAALRRFAALGKSTETLARVLECAYRKPSFADDRARIAIQAFQLGEKLGAIGLFMNSAEFASAKDVNTVKPLCTVRMLFE